jgi:adenylate kinase
VTGTPGTGKTTLSRLLSSALGATHIDLSEYSKENGLILTEDHDRETSVVDIEKLSHELNKIVKRANDYVVLDGHYAHDVVKSTYVWKVLVLRRAPWLLKVDLESRGYSSEKIRENVEAEIMGVCVNESLSSFPVGKVCEIDTTDKSPEESLSEALSSLRDEKNCEGERIDWLTYEETLKLLRDENVHNR